MAISSSEGTDKEGEAVALNLRECFDCLELKDSDDQVECLWVRISGKANKANILVGVCYRPPNQDEEADEIFYKQLPDASRLPALILVGDFNLLDICWKLTKWRGGTLEGSWSLGKITS
ncbi:hypothetical protein BTVI_124379 [Pitangus sulphuratus]|nr:hypothetical protein BTVI_124379 [Pitangus sulphuratus]